MNKIFWLASYPKSGNTWLRTWLTNYLRNSDEPARINELEGEWIASLREQFDDIVGLESSALTEKQIAYYRPFVYEQMSARSTQQLFLKIHDAYQHNDLGNPIFSPRATAGIIYIIRNPLDVAVSFAHHQATTIDEIIDFMGDENAALTTAGSSADQLPQKLMSWSAHVRSWVNQSDVKVHVVRYEDMVSQPYDRFAGIARFAGFSEEPSRIQKAIEFSCFEQLQAQEATYGFAEKQPTATSFFRRGRVGDWREHLTAAQVKQLSSDHDAVMRQFGYGHNRHLPTSRISPHHHSFQGG